MEDYKKKCEEYLARAKQLNVDGVKRVVRDTILYIFPELRESKDEKIRKAIISYIDYEGQRGGEWFGVKVDDIIAWLEKQGEQKEYTFKSLPRLLDMIEPTSKAKTYCQKLIDTLVKEGYSTDAKIVRNHLKIMNGEKVAIATMDEQKSTDNLTPQEAMDIAVAKCFDEQKTTNKVEPKFHEGEWITCRELNTAKIISIDNDKYEVEVDGSKGFPHIDYVDRNFHLWTIEDAKDGDVLAAKDKDKIFIYNGKLDLRGRVCAYCGIYKTHDGLCFTECAFGNYFTYKEPYPATKEQRDILFAKMKEAGYEWDAKKKELIIK